MGIGCYDSEVHYRFLNASTSKTGFDYHPHNECSLSGLAKGDCYAMPSAIIHNAVVVEVVEDFIPLAERRLFTPTLVVLIDETHRD